MNIFLCHTPLHVLIAALELSSLGSDDSLIFAVDDVEGIHSLAHALLGGDKTKFHMLPGAATLGLTSSLKTIQKQNFVRIRKELASLLPTRLFVFFDQRAEAQALLNFRYRQRPRITLLEDGLSIYRVAPPFEQPLPRLLLNKLRFDPFWKGSKWLGQHPAIDEVACFFPDQLRNDLKRKPTRRIDAKLEQSRLERFLDVYGRRKYSMETGVVAVPHPEYGLSGANFRRFIGSVLEYFESVSLHPLFKVHPRDTVSQNVVARLAPQVEFAPRNFPIELMTLVEPNLTAMVGFRTSSLHVSSALQSKLDVFYYEPLHESGKLSSDTWHEFYEKVSVLPLPTLDP